MFAYHSQLRKNVARRRRSFRTSRRGTALVEFAISLPILFVLIFGGIEIANAISLQQFLTEATYQGALDAMQPDSLESDVTTRIEDILQTRGIVNPTIEIKGTDGTAFDTVPSGSSFFVRVSLDHGENYSGPTVQQFFDLTATSTTIRQ
jgi:hypothetical protein